MNDRDSPWSHIRGRGGRNSRGRGRSASKAPSQSSSNFPVLKLGNKSLINSKIEGNSFSKSKSISLEDIPTDNPLYQQLIAHIQEKEQSDTYASLTDENNIPKCEIERSSSKEIIFLLENSDIQRKDEPWKIFQRYLLKGLYFPGESYKTRLYYETILRNTGSAEFQHFTSDDKNVYNFSKIIIKQIISIDEWGMSTMAEKYVSVNNSEMKFTYWDYIQAFYKVFYYNNENHKHSWFLKICSKVFEEYIPNWFIKWWTIFGPTTKILPKEYLEFYKEWRNISPFLTELYLNDHICNLDCIDQMYFFIEFSIPWIHKWVPEFGYTEEEIPCLYRIHYNNFWYKLTRKDPKTNKLFGQELKDQIQEKIGLYRETPKKKLIADNSVKHIARRISIQEGDKAEMIAQYLEELRKSLLSNISEYEESVSMASQDSVDIMQDAQPSEYVNILTKEDEEKVQEFTNSLQEGQQTEKNGKRKRSN